MLKCPLVVWWKSRDKKQGRIPGSTSLLIQRQPVVFSSISCSHSCSNAAAPALLWADWCSRVLTVPALQVLVLVLTTPEKACKRNSIVNLYQDFKTSILPTAGGCSFITTGIFLMKLFGFIPPALLLLLFPLVTLTDTLTLP